MKNINNIINKTKLFTPIHLTKSASNQLLCLIKKNSQNKGIRLSIKKSGCAGSRIVMELAQEKKPEEIELSQNGAILFISKKTLTLLKGTKIDFITQGLNKIFQIKHSNAKNYCGCGESFEL